MFLRTKSEARFKLTNWQFSFGDFVNKQNTKSQETNKGNGNNKKKDCNLIVFPLSNFNFSNSKVKSIFQKLFSLFGALFSLYTNLSKTNRSKKCAVALALGI